MPAREIRRRFDYGRRMILIEVEDDFRTISHLQIQIQAPDHPEPDVAQILAAHLAMVDRNMNHFKTVANKHRIESFDSKANESL